MPNTDYVASWDALKATDPEVADAVAAELNRERTTLRLIASENYASPAVLAALASTMNKKYAEVMGDHRPARAMIPVKDLHFDTKIEIQAIAVKP